MTNWEWPQYTIAALYMLNVFLTSWLHGLPRTGKFSGPTVIVSASIGVWILYMGGFWS